MNKLEQLKEAYAASTQGEWEATKGHYGVYVTTKRDPNLPPEPSAASCYGRDSKENARAIALLHNRANDLLEAVELLRSISDIGYQDYLPEAVSALLAKFK